MIRFAYRVSASIAKTTEGTGKNTIRSEKEIVLSILEIALIGGKTFDVKNFTGILSFQRNEGMTKHGAQLNSPQTAKVQLIGSESDILAPGLTELPRLPI